MQSLGDHAGDHVDHVSDEEQTNKPDKKGSKCVIKYQKMCNHIREHACDKGMGSKKIF